MPDASSPYPPTVLGLFKIQLNVILSYMPNVSSLCSSFTDHKNCTRVTSVPTWPHCVCHDFRQKVKITQVLPYPFCCCNPLRPNVPTTVSIRRVKQERLTDNVYPEDGSTTMFQNAVNSAGGTAYQTEPGLRARRPTNHGSTSSRGRNFPPVQSVQTDSGADPTTWSVSTERVKQPGHEAATHHHLMPPWRAQEQSDFQLYD